MSDSRVTFTGVVPYVNYENAGAMLDWLSNAFGFVERARYVDKDGIVRQAEMRIGDAELWLGGHDPGYWERQGRQPTEFIGVWVDDVDAQYRRVRDAGVVADEPDDRSYDVRTFNVRDPEGYLWGFMRRLGTGYAQTIPTAEGGLEEIQGPGYR
jgi:uncharacterized glyoxalase superfamily protein PhnB